MGLWGKSTSAESRPKFLKGDGAEGAGGRTEDAFATTGGWALRAGTAASGNDNANAQPEVLVAIRGLSATLGAANVLAHMHMMVVLILIWYIHLMKLSQLHLPQQQPIM
jgi:hypothetical protein